MTEIDKKKGTMAEKRMITGETRDEAINRYRSTVFTDDWDKLSHAEKLRRINAFRGGY